MACSVCRDPNHRKNKCPNVRELAVATKGEWTFADICTLTIVEEIGKEIIKAIVDWLMDNIDISIKDMIEYIADNI